MITKRKCWANEQHSRRKCLEISGISESVSQNALEDKIQGVLRGIDVEVDTENIESCHHLKGKGSKGRVVLKLSKRKDAQKIKLNKKKLKNIDHKKIGLSSGTKVFINESLCGYYKLLWSKCKNGGVGNFIEFLQFRVRGGDKVLEQHLKNCSKNAGYISKTSQNDLISCCEQFITELVVRKIKENQFFSILADEASDCSNQEQLSLFVTYVDSDCAIKEEFLGFLHCDLGLSR